MRKILLILTLLVTSVYVAQSQTNPGNSVLNIVTDEGGRSVFYTEEVNKLTFTVGELNVFDSKGTSHTFDIGDILSLNFRNYPILTSLPAIVHAKEEKTSLYPNPATDRLYFKSTFVENDEVRVEILTLDGKILISKNTNAYELSISVSGLSPGMYICRISSRKELSSSKFIKK